MIELTCDVCGATNEIHGDELLVDARADESDWSVRLVTSGSGLTVDSAACPDDRIGSQLDDLAAQSRRLSREYNKTKKVVERIDGQFDGME